jgi:hypothetical protein
MELNEVLLVTESTNPCCESAHLIAYSDEEFSSLKNYQKHIVQDEVIFLKQRVAELVEELSQANVQILVLKRSISSLQSKPPSFVNSIAVEASGNVLHINRDLEGQEADSSSFETSESFDEENGIIYDSTAPITIDSRATSVETGRTDVTIDTLSNNIYLSRGTLTQSIDEWMHYRYHLAALTAENTRLKNQMATKSYKFEQEILSTYEELMNFVPLMRQRRDKSHSHESLGNDLDFPVLNVKPLGKLSDKTIETNNYIASLEAQVEELKDQIEVHERKQAEWNEQMLKICRKVLDLKALIDHKTRDQKMPSPRTVVTADLSPLKASQFSRSTYTSFSPAYISLSPPMVSHGDCVRMNHRLLQSISKKWAAFSNSTVAIQFYPFMSDESDSDASHDESSQSKMSAELTVTMRQYDGLKKQSEYISNECLDYDISKLHGIVCLEEVKPHLACQYVLMLLSPPPILNEQSFNFDQCVAYWNKELALMSSDWGAQDFINFYSRIGLTLLESYKSQTDQLIVTGLGHPYDGLYLRHGEEKYQHEHHQQRYIVSSFKEVQNRRQFYFIDHKDETAGVTNHKHLISNAKVQHPMRRLQQQEVEIFLEVIELFLEVDDYIHPRFNRDVLFSMVTTNASLRHEKILKRYFGYDEVMTLIRSIE